VTGVQTCALPGGGELLAKGAVPVEDVAVRLGYAEASSFIHAFKRWKGVTPTAYVRDRSG